jgi:hypothetical protein
MSDNRDYVAYIRIHHQAIPMPQNPLALETMMSIIGAAFETAQAQRGRGKLEEFCKTNP